MKNLKKHIRIFRSVLVTMTVLLSFTILLPVVSAQSLGVQVPPSNCFIVTVSEPTTGCAENTCNDNGGDGQCEICFTITITNNCPGLVLKAFEFSAEDADQTQDCRSICGCDISVEGPNGTPLYDCSWAGPRRITYTANSGQGLEYNMSFSFTVCFKEAFRADWYEIACVDATPTCECDSDPCTPAILVWAP